MSILTKVLKLFCYDPETDGANTFNIPKALNENWEKIDAAVAGKLSREDVAEEIKKAVEDGSLTAGDLGAVSEDMVGQPNGVAGLDETGKVPERHLPELNFDPSGSAAAVQRQLEAHAADKGNPHGVMAEQVGAFTKAQTLTAGTAALVDLGADAVPDAVFAKLKSLIDAANANAGTKLQIHFGSYVGTGTGNVSITAPFPVKLLSIYCKFQEVAEAKYFTQIDFQINPNVHNFSYNNLGGYQFRVADSSSSAKVGSISWSNSNKTVALGYADNLDISGITYHYYALG